MNSVRDFAGLLFVLAFGAHANAAAGAFEPEFEPAAGVFRFELVLEWTDGSPVP